MEKEIIESNGKKVSFITLGCKVNQYDSDAMRSLFIRNGYKVAKENENADVYVINTCSVTSIGDRKSRQMVRRIRREHPGAVIAAAGCYAQLAPDVFVQMGDVDVIVGIQNRSHIVEYVEEAAAEKKTLNAVGDIMAVTDFENLSVDAEGEVKTRAFIKIQEGCDNYCTFCIIPFARGKLKSRRQSDAVEEIRRLVEKGYREVVLTGIHLGNYGKDLHDGTSLSTLVTELVRIPDLLRIRLGSIESVELSDELIRIIREEPKVCPHLHLPIQAGSDDILKRMNRHGDRETLTALIKKIREKIPNVTLRTTLITGFPGETKEQFEELCEFVKEIRFERLGCFAYSPEEGTPAEKFEDQVPLKDRERRAEIIMEEQMIISDSLNEAALDSEVEVVCEGFDRYAECYYGRSQADAPEIDGKIFFLSEDKVRVGEYVKVKIDDTMDYDLIGSKM